MSFVSPSVLANMLTTRISTAVLLHRLRRWNEFMPETRSSKPLNSDCTQHSSDVDSLSNKRTTKITKKSFNLEQYDSIQARTNRANIAQRPTELSRQRADKEAQCGRQTYDAVETRVVYNASSKPCSGGQSPGTVSWIWL